MTATTDLQIRPIAEDAQEVYQGKDRDLQRRPGTAQVFHRPAQQVIQGRIGILFTGKAEDHLTEMACGDISAVILPKGKMGFEQFRILEKVEAGSETWRLIEKVKLGVGFKLVNKALLAFQRTFGDGCETAKIMAVQGDEFIGFAVASNIEDIPKGGPREITGHEQ